MQHQLEEAYKKAVALAESYKTRGLNTLTEGEKEELNKTLKQIEAYNPATEPATVITELP